MQIFWISLLLPQLTRADSLSVFGHKAPDTDTITSALVYAWELNARGVPATAFRLGELTPETTYVLKTVGVDSPPLLGELKAKSKVAIVDTNNPSELPDGIDKAAIHSIVDHHKLFGGLKTSEAVEIDMRPLCSATSILYARAKASRLVPPKEIAGLMLAGILADSLGFRSPTTTELDKANAAELAAISGLDIKVFGDAMLTAKADIGHLSAADLVAMDSKIFTIGGKKMRISVLETTAPAAPLAMMAELRDAMKLSASEEKLDEVLFFVVDVLNEAATFVTSSPNASKIVENAWHVKVGSDGTVVLPGVLSRKKQIIPALEASAAQQQEL